jgi:hypothetical protein
VQVARQRGQPVTTPSPLTRPDAARPRQRPYGTRLTSILLVGAVTDCRWTDALEPVLDELVATAQGHVDLAFWKTVEIEDWASERGWGHKQRIKNLARLIKSESNSHSFVGWLGHRELGESTSSL